MPLNAPSEAIARSPDCPAARLSHSAISPSAETVPPFPASPRDQVDTILDWQSAASSPTIPIMSDFSHIPEGYHSVTPSLTVRDAEKALAFYAAAFGAEETLRLPDEATGKLMHAEFRIGNSTIMISDEYPDWGALAPAIGEGGAFMIYVENADESFARAIAAGATEITPLADMFWGDRVGRVADPFGYRWSLAQKIRDVSPGEIIEGAQSWSAEQP